MINTAIVSHKKMCRNLDVFYFVCCCCAIKRASTPSEFLIELEQISHLSRTLEPMLSSFGSPFSVYFSARRALGFLARKLLFISFHFARSPVDGDEEMGKTNTDEISRAHPKECRRGLIICECVYNNNAPFFTFFILLRFGIIPHFVVGAAMRLFWTRSLCVCLFISRLWKQ